MIVLDASVLIAHLVTTEAHHESAQRLLARLSYAPLVASVITVAEVLTGPSRHGQLDRFSAALDRLGVISIGLGDDSGSALAELRGSTGLKLPDCCVLLAAETTRGELATFDRRLATVAGRRGVTVHDGT